MTESEHKSLTEKVQSTEVRKGSQHVCSNECAFRDPLYVFIAFLTFHRLPFSLPVAEMMSSACLRRLYYLNNYLTFIAPSILPHGHCEGSQGNPRKRRHWWAWMDPNDVGDPLTFHLGPPAAQSFHFARIISTSTQWIGTKSGADIHGSLEI